MSQKLSWQILQSLTCMTYNNTANLRKRRNWINCVLLCACSILEWSGYRSPKQHDLWQGTAKTQEVKRNIAAEVNCVFTTFCPHKESNSKMLQTMLPQSYIKDKNQMWAVRESAQGLCLSLIFMDLTDLNKCFKKKTLPLDSVATKYEWKLW